MAKKAQVQIELEEGGMVLSPISSLVIIQHIDWHHSFELRLSMRTFVGGQGSFAETSEKVIGQPIKIGLSSMVDSQADDNFFKGIITDIHLSRYHGATSEVVLRGYSPTILLEDGANTRSFEEMDLGQVAEEVMAPYPRNSLQSKVSAESVVLPYVVQYQESNYHFLSRLAAKYGDWFFYDGSELQFAKPESSKEIDLNLGKDLISYELGLKLNPIKFEMKSRDYLQDEVYSTPASNGSIQGLNSFGKFLEQTSKDVYSQEPIQDPPYYFKDQGGLDKFSLVKKSSMASEFVVLNGISDNIGVKIGNNLNIAASFGDIKHQAEQEDHKKYIIIQATHRVDGDGNYQNQFEAIPSTLLHAPPNPHIKRPIATAQRAKVVETHDPDGLARVRVQFYWQNGEFSPWIPVVQQHGGGVNGFFVIPEINDEVLVDFVSGDPDRPFVMGAVYHSNAKPAPEWDDPDNNIKAIKTKSGNEIRFTDKAGSEEIKIFNPESKNEITLSLSGSGSIAIKSEGDISISAGGSISMTAGKDISMTAEKKMNQTCEELTVESKKKTAFSAGTDYSLSSGTKLSVSSGTDYEVAAGTNAKLSANANMEMKANAMGKIEATGMMDVKATGPLTVQSSAIVTVQGTMVKLN